MAGDYFPAVFSGKDGTMDFNCFVAEVETGIRDYLPEEVYRNAELKHKEVVKNNNVKQTGLSVILPDNRISPVVYLEPFFESLKRGEALETILGDISSALKKECPALDIESEKLWDFSVVKDRIIFKLVNKGNNENYLSGTPYRIIADLALIYCIDLISGEGGCATAKITDQMMEAYGTDEDELYSLALRNTPERRPFVFQPLQNILSGFLGEGNVTEDAINTSMYVASNLQNTGGAAVVIYEDFDRKAREALGDYYILPSSTEEVIVIPKSNVGVGMLKDMVREINRNEVAPEQVLSDNVYEIRDGRLIVA